MLDFVKKLWLKCVLAIPIAPNVNSSNLACFQGNSKAKNLLKKMNKLPQLTNPKMILAPNGVSKMHFNQNYYCKNNLYYFCSMRFVFVFLFLITVTVA